MCAPDSHKSGSTIVQSTGWSGRPVGGLCQPVRMEIDDRVAVVTGAAAGIGQAIACRLAEHGARLVLADIAPCTQTLRMVEEAGGEATVVTADLGDDVQVRRLVDVTVERFGGIQILVNN